MLGLIKKVFGTKYDRDRATYQPFVDEVNEYFKGYKSLTNDELRGKTLDFRARIKEHLTGIDEDIEQVKQEALNEGDMNRKEELFKEVDELKKERDKNLETILKEILPEAFAVVKETARRFTKNETLTVTATDHDRAIAGNINKDYVTVSGKDAIWKNSWTAAGGDIVWNMVHYDVQLIGGMVLHDGKIAEMQTGEGKTLVATLPAYLNGLSGEGVHVITVNDYLARRDCEWIGPIVEFLYLTIDCIDKYKPHSEERKRAYRCDITYGTNNEFGFDYLRDNMVRSLDEMVQRKHHYAMVDEVDSVLIDDARTPLIISGPVPKGSEEQEYNSLKPVVEKLLAAQRKLAKQYLDEAKELFDEGLLGYEEGEAGMALLRAHRALPKHRPLIKFLSQEGVKVTLQKAENFYMQEQSKHMHIADEPLLFTIDEKNRQVELTERGTEYLAKGNEDPNFYIMPDIASEMYEIDENEELSEKEKDEARTKVAQDFSVKSKRLHAISQLLKAYTLFEKDEEYVVIDKEVKIVDESTGRMMEGRRYSDGLHQALEAKENVKIGNITQTYATVTLQNYFRMYHKLSGMTGTAETEAGEFWEIYKLDVVVIPTNRPIVRDDMDDKVYKTEREKFEAVIEDIKKLTEAGRPVLVGTTSVEISERLSRTLDEKGISHNVLNAKQHQREAEIVAEAGRPGKVTLATNMAGRGTDIKLSDEVKKAGGLAIIATERHDSRRVDRQLRGRAGRQGDPGSSQFYVSLEDKLMRLFQSERIAKMMDKMGHQEGEVIQHGMVSKSIERAQKKVEENNFGVRKRLLEYDDVMNIQREAIYKKRYNALSGERLSVDLNNMFLGITESLIETHFDHGDFEGLSRDSLAILGVNPQIDFIYWLVNHFGAVKRYFTDLDNRSTLKESVSEIEKNLESFTNEFFEKIHTQLDSFNQKESNKTAVQINDNDFSGLKEDLRQLIKGGKREQKNITVLYDKLCKTEKTTLNKIYNYLSELVEEKEENPEKINVGAELREEAFQEFGREKMLRHYRAQVDEFYEKKSEQITEFLLPMITDVHKNEGHRFKRIAVPFTDGTQRLNISAGLEEAVNSKGGTIMRDIEKAVSLAIIDDAWKEHLRSMDELKDASQAASFEQKDPLVVYKMEAYNLFEGLVYKINEEVTSYLNKGTLIFKDGTTLEEARIQRTDLSQTSTNRAARERAAHAAAAAAGQRRAKPETFKRKGKKLGPNDPCHCGSGKKYKKCHKKADEKARRQATAP